jgi:hypothetical protein
MDAGAFESALARLLDDPDFAARLGATARDDALEHHVGDVHLVRWAEVIDRLINR